MEKSNQKYLVYQHKTNFMRPKLFLFTLSACLFILFSGCKHEVNLSDKINELSAKVYNDSTKRVNEVIAKEYVATCEQFADKFPQDTLSPVLLLKAAETARNIRDFNKALALYDRIINNFGDYKKAPQAMFLKAFTIDDNLGKKEEAKVIYETFLEKYPADEFASSAQFMLDNLYKSDEEIIKQFEEKEKAKQAEVQ